MTPEQHNFVEHIAKEQIKYESIFTEQANVLQADLKGYQVAMTQIKQPPLIAKCGQCQEPPLDEVDQYLIQCDNICQIVPHNVDE